MWNLPGPGMETCLPCIDRQILNHWTTREDLEILFFKLRAGSSISSLRVLQHLQLHQSYSMSLFSGIAHLPQVAAKGTAHYLVSKEIDPATSKAVSTIKRLSDDQRVLELARMLSGSVLTDAAIANAESLLKG